MKQLLNIVLLAIVITYSSNVCRGQLLNYKDLFLLQANNLSFADNYLTKKGWDYHSSEVESDYEYFDFSMVSWSFNKNSWNNKAKGWFYLYQSKGYGNMINFKPTSVVCSLSPLNVPFNVW